MLTDASGIEYAEIIYKDRILRIPVEKPHNQEAVKTLKAIFENAEKMRERNRAIP